ncbi:MAG: PHP domain-containing protein [Propionibacteriales bacterium]|nr:PHP domain-containing protein [Propionibacteriales bacterium]
MRIDLHTHSTASDGTHTPDDVVRLAAAAGLDALALTDHDSMAGWAEAATAAARYGLAVVPGMEISTTYAGAGVHLLGYLLDPTYEPLAAELAMILHGREGRLPAVIDRLRRAGMDITERDVRLQVGPAPAIGRPHIADVMVAKGIVADRAEAFATWLSAGRPGHVERYATKTTTMIELVTAAGGAAVIAHPWGRGSRRVVDLEALAVFTDAGLVGLEVDHQDHSSSDRRALRAMAGELGLVVTGSSDFHGDGKVDHDLGCNLTAVGDYETLLDAAASNAATAGLDVPRVARP